MKLSFVNDFNATLTNSIGPTDTVLTLTVTGSAPTIPSTGIIPLSILNSNSPGTVEVVYCSSITNNQYTVLRSRENTNPLEWAAGSSVISAPTAGVMGLATIAGFAPLWSQTISNQIGGYPQYSIVQDSSYNLWVSLSDYNTSQPSPTGQYWTNIFGQYASKSWVELNYVPFSGGTITGSLTIDDNLTTQTMTVLGDMTVDDTITTEYIDVTGNATINTMTANGDVTFAENITVDGTTSTNILTVTGNTTLDTMTSTGNITIEGNANLNTIVATGNSTLNTVTTNGNITLANSAVLNLNSSTGYTSAIYCDAQGSTNNDFTIRTGTSTAFKYNVFQGDGRLTLGTAPTASMDAVNLSYLSTAIANALPSYVKGYETGLRLQVYYVGTVGYSANGTAITFPVAFSAIPYAVVANASGNGDMDVWTYNWSATGCTINIPNNSQVSGLPVSIIAIGPV